jgi:hypothetical protein
MEDGLSGKQKHFNQWIKLSVVLAVAIIFLTIAGILLRQQSDFNELDLYLKTVNQNQLSAKAGLDMMNKDLGKFDGSPKAAVELSTKFKEAKQQLSDAKNILTSIIPPTETKNFHVHLLEFYDDMIVLIDDMIVMSEYVSKSSLIMDRFSKASSTFTSTISTVKNDRDMIETILKYKKTSDIALKEMQAVSPSLMYADTHRVTVDYFKNLSGLLEGLVVALKNEDDKAVESFLSETVKLAMNVGKAQEDGIRRGSVKYNERLKQINKRHQEVIDEYNALRSLYESY